MERQALLGFVLFGLIYSSGATVAAESTTAAQPKNDSAAATTSFPDDGDQLDGDHLKLRVNVYGFEAIDGPQKGNALCAPKGSKISVTMHEGDQLFVRFRLPKTDSPKQQQSAGLFSTGEALTQEALADCPAANMVNGHTQYKISHALLSQHAHRRTGVMFGALVVPFKFHLGGSSKLSSSSTIAPYVGFRGPAPFGLAFTPVLSAGLGLVPISNATTGETETKSAFSAAIGILLTHSKNDQFNAGVLFGKDFLSKSDRAGDDAVDKVWFSLYAGYKL
jgi:hypothetical protein